MRLRRSQLPQAVEQRIHFQRHSDRDANAIQNQCHKLQSILKTPWEHKSTITQIYRIYILVYSIIGYAEEILNWLGVRVFVHVDRTRHTFRGLGLVAATIASASRGQGWVALKTCYLHFHTSAANRCKSDVKAFWHLISRAWAAKRFHQALGNIVRIQTLPVKHGCPFKIVPRP